MDKIQRRSILLNAGMFTKPIKDIKEKEAYFNSYVNRFGIEGIWKYDPKMDMWKKVIDVSL